jgi:hypothetical protein
MVWAGADAMVWDGEWYQSHWIDERASERAEVKISQSF